MPEPQRSNRVSFKDQPGVRQYRFTQEQLDGLSPFAVSKGDVVAVDFSFGGEPGDRLWKRIEQESGKLGALLESELDNEFGDAWENMVTIYRGSTRINVVLNSNGDDDPKKSIFTRAWNAIKKAVQAFVAFANELWPHVKTVGCWIKKTAAQFLDVKHAADDLAEVFGFNNARQAAKAVIAWILVLWGFGPGLA